AASTTYQASTASRQITVVKQTTSLKLTQPTGSGPAGAPSTLLATLTNSAEKSLTHKSVVVTVTGRGGSYTTVLTTDYHGHASLGAVPLPASTYLVTAQFGDITITANDQTATLSDNLYA